MGSLIVDLIGDSSLIWAVNVKVASFLDGNGHWQLLFDFQPSYLHIPSLIEDVAVSPHSNKLILMHSSSSMVSCKDYHNFFINLQITESF